MNTRKCLFQYLGLVLICTTVCAQSETFIHYQGKLSHDVVEDSATRQLTFQIHSDPIASALVWEETHQDVDFKQGIFSVELGSQMPFPDTAFVINRDRWLEIWVGNQKLEPRQRLLSVPYANKAMIANSLAAPDGEPANAVIINNDGYVGIGVQPRFGSMQQHTNHTY